MLVEDVRRSWFGALCATLFFLWLVNFLVFSVISGTLGGDALNGHTDGAHYFLGDHGKLTEVSRSVFEYSRMHELSTLVTLPIMLISGLTLVLRQRARRATERHASPHGAPAQRGDNAATGL